MPGHWPLLCLEIVSPPKQTVEGMLKKCELYHKQGVSYCWVIEPESRAAWTYHKGGSSKWICESAGGVLDANTISIQLTDVWRGLKDKRSSRVE
jgi:Uma2 family endonuclease